MGVRFREIDLEVQHLNFIGPETPNRNGGALLALAVPRAMAVGEFSRQLLVLGGHFGSRYEWLVALQKASPKSPVCQTPAYKP